MSLEAKRTRLDLPNYVRRSEDPDRRQPYREIDLHTNLIQTYQQKVYLQSDPRLNRLIDKSRLKAAGQVSFTIEQHVAVSEA